MDLSRRDFLASSTAAAASGALGGSAQAQTPALVAQTTGAPAPRGFDPADPALKYELVVANGDVLDPSQKLRGKRDIGIRFGQIAAIAASIPPDRSVQRIDVAGRLVTPGLIDLHTHLCPAPGPRTAGRRAGGHHVHDHRGLGRGRRLAHVGRLPTPGAGELSHPLVLLRAHLVDRPGGRPGAGRDAEHRLRQRRRLRQGGGREPGRRARREGADHRLGGRSERAGAAAARAACCRDRGKRHAGDVSHRFRAWKSVRSSRPWVCRFRDVVYSDGSMPELTWPSAAAHTLRV